MAESGAAEQAITDKAREAEEKRRARIEAAIRATITIQDTAPVAQAVENLASTIAIMTRPGLAVGTPTPFRDAGTLATDRQLASLNKRASALAFAVLSLNEPAVVALADAGFLHRADLLRLARAACRSATAARKRVTEAAKREGHAKPQKGRPAEPLALNVARLCARDFETMAGAKPTADGRASKFVNLLRGVFMVTGIRGNARHYAAQALAGREVP